MNEAQRQRLVRITERLQCQDDVTVIADTEERVEVVVGLHKGRRKRVELDADGRVTIYEPL